MMPALYRLLSLRYLLQRWDRAALIVASIALGVATLVSTRILNSCVATAAQHSTTPLGIGDLYVSNGDVGVIRSVSDDLKAANIPGVKSIQPLIVERVSIPGESGPKTAVLVGVELSTQMVDPDNPLGVTVHNTLERNSTTAWLALTRRLVVLSRHAYDAWLIERKNATDPLILRCGTRQVECLPIGYFEMQSSSPMAALGTQIIGMELGQAVRFLHPGPALATAAIVGPTTTDTLWEHIVPPRVNRIDVLLESGADLASVQAELQQVVGLRAEVRTPEAHARSTQEIVGGLQIAFVLCSFGAMVVGLFLVYNAMSVTVAERRHDIGILRSLGATRWQIIAIFGTAALVLGVLGAIVGIPLGTGLARLIVSQFQEELGSLFMNPEVDPVWPGLNTILIAGVAGVLTALLAALIPALQAATQDPADAVRRVPGIAGGVWQLAHRATCGTLIAGGVAMILTRHELPPRVGAFGGMVAALIGLLLAAPILVGILVRIAHPLLRRVLPIEARLAADNLLRSPGRTGVVIGALGAGVAIMVQTAGVGRSNEEPVVAWLEEVIQADRFVFSGNLTEATSSSTSLNLEVPQNLGKLPGVEAVVSLRYVVPEYNGTRIFLTAIDAAAYAEHTGRRRSTDHEGLEKLRFLQNRNAVLISDNFARRHGVQPGDTIQLAGPAGPISLEVHDTIRDYSWSRGTIFMDRAVYARLFRDPLINVCHVYLAADGQGDAAIEEFAANERLTVLDRSSLRQFLAELIDRVYVLAFLQQIIVGLVAGLGVVTALLISVLQRKRELGLLLAVGATPAQVVRSVLWEAVLMGGFGTLLGILIGLPMEWYVLRVVLVEESGFVFDLVVPWRQGLGIAVGAMLVAAVAGLMPALHAVRTRIPEAIAYE